MKFTYTKTEEVGYKLMKALGFEAAKDLGWRYIEHKAGMERDVQVTEELTILEALIHPETEVREQARQIAKKEKR